MNRRLVPVLLAVLLAGAGCIGGGESAPAVTGGGLRAGGLETVGELPSKPITDQAFTDFDDQQGTFARFAGKPLVVNFWSSSCVPCITEMPDFEAVYQELGQEVGFVGVNVVDIPSEATRMARQTGVTYPLVRDPDGALLGFVGGIAMPTTAFVSADGEVLKVISRQLSAADLRDHIAELR
ncbi:MAG: TlpA family protein disulfide reductase [Acidimicrobiales bacterium]